ncbi:MAG: M6 family metalloprotease domain-containing protein [Clostridia bacterium]|nr:M6 family metalloprotease domain-containing protein [Clostridia bacterium]
MCRNRIVKALFTLVCAAVLFAIAAVCAWAVPAKPDTGLKGEAAACRSHPGALVTLDSIPARRGGAHPAPSIAPAQKNIPLLTVVIGFENMPYDNGYDWHETMYSGEKSLEAYYTDMSFGKFTFVPAAETSAFGVGDNTNTSDRANDGVVHVKLSSDHKDWAGEDEYPSQAQAMIDALGAADGYVDFASFDADGNGEIGVNELAVGFVFAGYEASAAYSYPQGRDKYLWAHAWTIADIISEYTLDMTVPTPDGTAVSAYIAIAEYIKAGEKEPISVLAHELGHYLGLPDLYDTTYSASVGWGKYAVGYVSVMADGSWGDDPDGGYVPYSFDVWSRYALGWIEPETVTDAGEYTVAAQSYTEDDAFSALLIPTQRDGEYYLLENRQFTKWDAGMADIYPEGGIIVWHIDDAVFEEYNENNQVNDAPHRPAVMPLFPEQKDGGYTYIGATTKVFKNKPFYTASAWSSLFPGENALDLPLYGAGDDANTRAARTLSGIKLGFQSETAPEMTVLFSDADHVHFLTGVDAVAPDCENAGNEPYWVCDYCGGLFADPDGEEPTNEASVAIPAKGHSFGDWNVTTEPGCEKKGVKTRVCADCGKTEKVSLKALGHSFGEWETKEPTCTKTGEKTRVCARCGKEEAILLPALGHTEPDENGCCERCGEQIVIQEDPGQPEDPQDPEDLCKFCGKGHSNQPFGWLIRVFHNILYFFGKIFGRF